MRQVVNKMFSSMTKKSVSLISGTASINLTRTVKQNMEYVTTNK